MFTAVLDTCVLVPSFLRDALLEVAEAGVYRAVWSEAILDELEDPLLYLFDHAGRDPQESRSATHRLRRQMTTAFPDAVVTDWEPLEDVYELPDPDDRHVLAAAVKGRADVIVTDNLKDFPGPLATSGCRGAVRRRVPALRPRSATGGRTRRDRSNCVPNRPHRTQAVGGRHRRCHRAQRRDGLARELRERRS